MLNLSIPGALQTNSHSPENLGLMAMVPEALRLMATVPGDPKTGDHCP